MFRKKLLRYFRAWIKDEDVEKMDIKIIAEASTGFQRRFTGWGVSFLIDNDLLFDTFSNYRILKRNMKKQNVDIADLKYVVISHEHWDHTNGLWYILENNSRVKVFICPGFSDEFKEKLSEYKADIIEVKAGMKIKDKVYTTGEITGEYDNGRLNEQSLIIVQDKISIITGCSHPGITGIVRKVKDSFSPPVGLVLGGFHLTGKPASDIQAIIEQLKNMQVEKIAPCHCTGRVAVQALRGEYKENLIDIKTGMTVAV